MVLNFAHADYTVNVVSSTGQSTITVVPLQKFTVDIFLESDANDSHNSVVLDLLFSDSGLTYHDFQWQPPFVTGGFGDDSFPAHEDLSLTLTPLTLSGPSTNEGIIDLRLSNLAIDNLQSDPFFKTGRLVILEFSASKSTRGEIRLTPKPIAVGRGLQLIPVNLGSSLTVTVVPEPDATALMFVGLGFVFLCLRKTQVPTRSSVPKRGIKIFTGST